MKMLLNLRIFIFILFEDGVKISELLDRLLRQHDKLEAEKDCIFFMFVVLIDFLFATGTDDGIPKLLANYN